ncbi:MAG: HAMP domain-containing sensor histidine kinase [Saprospiraceae bacterium]|nr:HAMP domain-containing sensor histidine kinase [Saprospiraceae bacterium]
MNRTLVRDLPYLYSNNLIMTTIRRHITPWALVILSMVMLILFVGYWNYSTYLKEKQKLANDVEIQLQLAYTEVKDSELILFIKTQLSDSLFFNTNFPDSISFLLDEHPMFPSLQTLQARKTIDTLPDNLEGDTTIVFDFSIKKGGMPERQLQGRGNQVTIVASSHLNSNILENLSKEESNDSSKIEFDIRQIDIKGNPNKRMLDYRVWTDSNTNKKWFTKNDSILEETIFSTLQDSLGDLNSRNTIASQISGNTHTSVDKTYALFNQKLKENNLPIDYEVVSFPDQPEKGLRITYHSNGLSFSDWTIDLLQYKVYILKKMLPNLLFSLILLGIISLAFWTLLQNWIKERRLALVKNEFINNMTHELKTPIATVGVALEAISNFDLTKEGDKTKEYVEMSRSEINRLSLLVDKVLNIAAFDSSNAPLNKEEVNLDSIISDNLHAMKLQIDQQNAVVEFNNNCTISKVIGDHMHLTNVIHNMLDNALKYSSEQPKITISLDEHLNHYSMIIADNGPGIPKAYQDKIFDRFFRVPTHDIHDVKGHGLGLNYVQNVIQMHGGNITVESAAQKGTSFTISLPKMAQDV